MKPETDPSPLPQAATPDKFPAGRAAGPAGREGPEESEASGDSLEWRRKAGKRRLQANRSIGSAWGVEGNDHSSPVFSVRREVDWTPEFDQAAAPAGDAGGKRPRPAERLLWLALLPAVGIVLYFILRGESLSGSSVAPDAPNAADSRLREEVRASALAVPAARRLVARFFAAVTPGEKCTMVRGGRAMLTAMEAYYATHPDEPERVTLASSVEFMEHGGRSFLTLTGTDSGSVPFEAIVENTPGGPRLDWRSLTGTGDMDWARWVAERPAGSVLHRVVAELDDYPAGPFTDRAEWVCVRITDPARTATVWAYASRTSPAGMALLRDLGRRPVVRLQGRFEFPAVSRPDSAATVLTPLALLHSVEDKGWLDQSPEATSASPD